MNGKMPGVGDTVLVIDDEPGTLGAITARLENAGITVLVATSGEAALGIVERVVPDLIIVDALMPGIDGFETTRQIKRKPRLAGVPFIFMTGLTESEHVVRAFDAGGSDYVRKPVDLEELLARVRVHIAQGRAAHASAASLDATGRMMLTTDEQGRMTWCTPRTEETLARLMPEWTEVAALPPELKPALDRLLQYGSPGSTAGVRLTGFKGETTLELVLVARYRANKILFRLNELDPSRDVGRLTTGLGLTSREAQVLLWVSYGKSNGDISEVLQISPRTVQKHLEHVYEKLGVETRSAAAAIAVRMIEP